MMKTEKIKESPTPLTAVEMGRKRWADKTVEERQAHAQQMVEARLAKSARAVRCVVCRIRKDRQYMSRERPLACIACMRTAISRGHNAVATAVRKKQLAPVRGQTCVDCGKPAQAYEHRDYRFPLQVEPVCHCCNKQRGPAISFGDWDVPETT